MCVVFFFLRCTGSLRFSQSCARTAKRIQAPRIYYSVDLDCSVAVSFVEQKALGGIPAVAAVDLQATNDLAEVGWGGL